MVFAYYSQLNAKQRRIYRTSDRVVQVIVPAPRRLRVLAGRLRTTLEREDRIATQATAQALMWAITEDLGVVRTRVRVLAARPYTKWTELQGIYQPADGRKLGCITVWMRTARRRQVVAYRTFLRTLLHELCHHLDYELLGLEDSFHTQGFYKRESSLFNQLVPKRRAVSRDSAR